MTAPALGAEMAQHTAVRQSRETFTLDLWAGRLLVAISLAHLVLLAVVTWQDWSTWASGGLWGDPVTGEQYRLHFGFWALLGSFAVPLLMFGLLVIHLSRHRVALPGYVGWGFLAWVLVCAALLEPSGYPAGLVPAFLLIVADRRRH